LKKKEVSLQKESIADGFAKINDKIDGNGAVCFFAVFFGLAGVSSIVGLGLGSRLAYIVISTAGW